MSGYTKNIAVIKGLKDGFSADGGPLTGLVKAERYGNSLKVEVTFINFAPLSEGRYVTALSDGNTTLVVEDGRFDGVSALDTGGGFAALICYVNGQVSPVASAVSGNFGGAALGIKEFIEKAENIRSGGGDKTALSDNAAGKNAKVRGGDKYDDEAISEVNYYEFAETDESGGAVRKGSQKETDGRKAGKNASAFGSVKKDKSGVNPDISRGETAFKHSSLATDGVFYDRMKGEIEGLFATYPAEEALSKTVKNSRWVKISYGDGKYYVFGLIYDGEKPRYICYGVPAEDNKTPPESMRGLASFIPSSPNGGEDGFWVMYQDAFTGASLKIDFE